MPRRAPPPLAPLALLATLAAAPGCKVDFIDIGAAFTIADAAWFAEEETLFVFYEAEAAQGLGADTVIELTFTTDDGVVDWTAIDSFSPVHPHVPADCGPDRRCGSTSLHVPREPRDVAVRLRYHRDGALTLDPVTRLNIIGPGPAHTHRSLLVYGVFAEDARSVQWRARHRFPTLRNEEAQRLGLRRRFTIDRIRPEATAPDPEALANPWLYGAPCPSAPPLDWATVDTTDRAAFSPEALPAAAFDAAALCARATVQDPTGPFEAPAHARKNPEVRPAVPLRRSPIREATPVKYLLAICDRPISATHRQMQEQRLLMQGIEPICLDDFAAPSQADALVDMLLARWRRDLETVRAGGRDMILAAAVHHDDRRLSTTLERAIAALLATENDRNTPRLAGAFLLDSYPYEVTQATVGASTIWCPSSLDLDLEDLDALDPAELPASGVASLVCALPDIPQLRPRPLRPRRAPHPAQPPAVPRLHRHLLRRRSRPHVRAHLQGPRAPPRRRTPPPPALRPRDLLQRRGHHRRRRRRLLLLLCRGRNPKRRLPRRRQRRPAPRRRAPRLARPGRRRHVPARARLRLPLPARDRVRRRRRHRRHRLRRHPPARHRHRRRPGLRQHHLAHRRVPLRPHAHPLPPLLRPPHLRRRRRLPDRRPLRRHLPHELLQARLPAPRRPGVPP
ncbi:MAG: hypothetical protein R3F65_19260 [bacterium]